MRVRTRLCIVGHTGATTLLSFTDRLDPIPEHALYSLIDSCVPYEGQSLVFYTNLITITRKIFSSCFAHDDRLESNEPCIGNPRGFDILTDPLGSVNKGRGW